MAAVTQLASDDAWSNMLESSKTRALIVQFASTADSASVISGIMFDQLSSSPDYRNCITFARVDAAVCPGTISANKVKTYPTFRTYVNGETVGERVGMIDVGSFSALLNDLKDKALAAGL